GGAGTAEQSMLALRTHGEVAFIGVLSPEGGPNPRTLMMSAGTMRGIFVGSAAMARRLNAAIDVNGIEPLIGARFGFEQAKEAYAHAWGPESFAKTVIELVYRSLPCGKCASRRPAISTIIRSKARISRPGR